jgi:hypothetical protein
MKSKKDTAPTSTSPHQSFRSSADGTLQAWDKACGKKTPTFSIEGGITFSHPRPRGGPTEAQCRTMARYNRGIVNLAMEQKSFSEKKAAGREKAEDEGGWCCATPLAPLLLLGSTSGTGLAWWHDSPPLSDDVVVVENGWRWAQRPRGNAERDQGI